MKQQHTQHQEATGPFADLEAKIATIVEEAKTFTGPDGKHAGAAWIILSARNEFYLDVSPIFQSASNYLSLFSSFCCTAKF